MSEPTREAISSWVGEQVRRFSLVRERYEALARVLSQILQRAAQKLAPQAIVQSRAKNIASFAGKLVRKRPAYWTPKDPLRELTDLCGGRVITHTAEEVQAVCRFIEEHFEVDWENSADVSQRLRPAEFGNRSVHYIVSLKPQTFPSREIPIAIPADLLAGLPVDICGGPDAVPHPLKAEIQVRTILEHAWADINHDLTYKSAARVPARFVRDVAAVAAVLEGADREFGRIFDGLRAYTSHYGAYLSPDEVAAEIQTLELTLQYDRDNAELATRISALAIAIGDWAKAIEVLRPYQDSNCQPAVRNLGIALCSRRQDQPDSAEFLEGRQRLVAASSPPQRDPEALCALADTWQTEDEQRARQLYRQAFELDPSHPRYLASYLEQEIACQRSGAIIPLVATTIAAACQRCRQQIEAGLELPWAYLNLAKFNLLQNQPYDSLAALAKTIQLGPPPFVLASAQQTLKRLRVIADTLTGYDWFWKLLLLGQATKYRDASARARLRELATPGVAPIGAPAVIVAGGCDASVEAHMQLYRQMLLLAFQGFEGTICSGGTRHGIAGLVGDVRQHHGGVVRTIGYIPHYVPADAVPDKDPNRYDELRRTPGANFTALEPLQNWIDLLASGIEPAAVKLVGINGGAIAAVEFRIAAALGAQVALVEDSGRAAARLLMDAAWEGTSNLLRVPADAMTLRLLIESGQTDLSDDLCQRIAQEIHSAYRRNKAQSQPADPSLAEWDALPDTLRKSNLSQARHVLAKLREIGCEVAPRTGSTEPEFAFTDSEVEHLAEIEHGRWNAERLRDGWRYGETKDVQRKISPYLISWRDLPEDVRRWDRAAVLEIPRLIAEVGLGIRRQATTAASVA